MSWLTSASTSTSSRQTQGKEACSQRGRLQSLQAYIVTPPCRQTSSWRKANILLIGPDGHRQDGCSRSTLAKDPRRTVLRSPMRRRSRRRATSARTSRTSCCRLIQAADFDMPEVPSSGIVYIDEIDKIARKSDEPVDHARRLRRGRAAGAAQDHRGHRRQRAAARCGRKHPHQDFIQINTANILFIVRRRLRGPRRGIVSRRTGHRSDKRSLGFRAPRRVIRRPRGSRMILLKHVSPRRPVASSGSFPSSSAACRWWSDWKAWTRRP